MQWRTEQPKEPGWYFVVIGDEQVNFVAILHSLGRREPRTYLWGDKIELPKWPDTGDADEANPRSTG